VSATQGVQLRNKIWAIGQTVLLRYRQSLVVHLDLERKHATARTCSSTAFNDKWTVEVVGRVSEEFMKVSEPFLSRDRRGDSVLSARHPNSSPIAET
jgi:hypothetical protein